MGWVVGRGLGVLAGQLCVIRDAGVSFIGVFGVVVGTIPLGNSHPQLIRALFANYVTIKCNQLQSYVFSEAICSSKKPHVSSSNPREDLSANNCI